MKIILIDDEPLILEELSYLCEKHKDIKICGKFVNPKQSLQYVAEDPVDFAFLDIQMPGITGLKLLEEMRKVKRDLQAAFITAYDQYAMKAYQLDACDYLLKPFGQKEVDHALDKARRLVRTEMQEKETLQIHTFGRFDVFLNGHAVDFSSRKAKELLALLVARRGGMVDMEVAIDLLWEEEPFSEQVKGRFRKAVMNLKNTLRTHDLLWMLHTERGRMCLETTGINCDYFELMDGKIHAAEKFEDEFMMQYSWSEAFVPVLERQANLIKAEYGR